MGLQHSPSIVTTGLVLAIDAANPKTYDTKHNLAIYSQDWTQYVQTSANATVTAANTIAPDGTLTGQRITTTVSGRNNDGLVQKLYSASGRNIAPINKLINFSVYVKQGTSPKVSINLGPYNGSQYKDLITTLNWADLSVTNTGTQAGRNYSGVIPAANGWYRLWQTTDNYYGATDFGYRIYTRDQGANNVAGEYSYIWGAQVEFSNTPGPYIATTFPPVFPSNNVIDLARSNQGIYLANDTYYTANSGGYFVLNGSSSIACATPMEILSVPGTVTQEAFVYLEPNPGNIQSIFTRGQTAVAFNYGMAINVSNRLCFRNSNNDYALQSDTLTVGNWYHLVIVTDPSGSTGYINGIRKNTVTNTITGLTSPYNFWTIGCRPIPGPTVWENFYGNVAMFRVYHGVAFTPDQVLQNFNAIKGRYGL